jgi:putative ABC transport system permease protein
VTTLPFAWRSLVRQPARSGLGILGVAAVGALLFDMLLLSQGLIVSMRDLLDRTGYDVRVTTTTDLPRTAPRLEDAARAVDDILALPEVRGVVAIRFADATLERAEDDPIAATLHGVAGTSRPWTVLRGRDIGADAVVVNQAVADALQVEPGGELTAGASCGSDLQVLPAVRLRVAGVAAFPFELTGEHSVGLSLDALGAACGNRNGDEADLLLVASSDDADAAAAAIRRVRPDLSAATNEQMLGRIQRGGFTYFTQISTVLTTVTIAFAWLLIAVLLTVSVNQRLGEIAALRALGLSRRRVVTDILCESALIVGSGGLLSLPLGLALASGLDRILKQMPNIPADLHFFVFEPAALVVHLVLLAATAVLAALYPMRLVARLPIAATLRDEVIS